MNGTELANGGDHPALNFLNTRLKPWGEQIELLSSGKAFLDWLASTDLIDESERALLAERFPERDLDDAAAKARDFREWLRGEIAVWAEPGDQNEIPTAVEQRLNRILATDNQYLQIQSDNAGVPNLQVRRRWETADQLLVLPAASTADLFATGDCDLVRVCDAPNCTIWFYDRTKSHRRRWCSMDVCGNREKARNHRARAMA